MTVLGDEIKITKATDSEYFKFFIDRYEGGYGTLRAGCKDEGELIMKLVSLLNEAKKEGEI